MKTSKTAVSTGMDQFTGLITRWGMPSLFDAGGVEARAKRAQLLVSDLTTLLNEAASNQAQTILSVNQQFARDVQGLISARQPAELMAAQSTLVSGFLQCAAAQVKAWIDLTQQAHDCCSAAVREAAVEKPRPPRR